MLTRPLPPEVRRDWLPALDLDVLGVAWDDMHRLRAQRDAFDALPDESMTVTLDGTEDVQRIGRRRSDVENVEYTVPPLEFGPLDELRGEHHRLIGAWEAIVGRLRSAEADATAAQAGYRRELREAARSGGPAPEPPGTVAGEMVEVLREDEQAARVALAEMIERAVARLGPHRSTIRWSRNVMATRKPSGGQIERRLRVQAKLLVGLDASLGDWHNRGPVVRRWATGAPVDLESVADGLGMAA